MFWDPCEGPEGRSDGLRGHFLEGVHVNFKGNDKYNEC